MGRLEQEIRELIEFRYGNVARFARRTGIPQQTIYSALRKNLTNSSVTTVIPIAEALDLDPFHLIHGEIVFNSRNKETVKVPLVSKITGDASEPSLKTSTAYPIPAELHDRHPKAFLLKINCEDMNTTLPKGCYALVDPCRTINHPGDPYAVITNRDGAIVRLVHPLNNGIRLMPSSLDPTIKPETIDFEERDRESVSIVGRVIWYCVPLDWRFQH